MTCTRRPVILVFVVAVLFTSAFPNQKDDEAKAHVGRAMSTSAIREEGSSPFRLKANVKVTREDGSTVEGTYTETWFSNSASQRDCFGRVSPDAGYCRTKSLDVRQLDRSPRTPRCYTHYIRSVEWIR